MIARLHREWLCFVKAEAGERFQLLHREQQAGHLGGRIARWTLGIAALLLGAVMLLTPGPGLLTMAFGAACLARESLGVAVRCDRLELRLRAAWRRLRRRAPAGRG